MGSTAARAAGAVLLLIGSNSFMNAAWYLHLRIKSWPLVAAIFISWGIAFFEYCLQVPANRLGHFNYGGPFTAPQLKVIQEAISLSTFAIFSVLVLKEKLGWRDGVAFALIFTGVAVSLAKPPTKGNTQEAPAPEIALPQLVVAPVPGAGATPPGMEHHTTQPKQGRRLLQQLMLPWRRSAGSSGYSRARAFDASNGQGSSYNGMQLPGSGQPGADSLADRSSSAGAGGSVSGSLQPAPELLPGLQVRRESSTAVLIAGDVEVHASSSRWREHSQDAGRGGSGAGGAEEEQRRAGSNPGAAAVGQWPASKELVQQ